MSDNPNPAFRVGKHAVPISRLRGSCRLISYLLQLITVPSPRYLHVQIDLLYRVTLAIASQPIHIQTIPKERTHGLDRQMSPPQ
jgi:hypothetical protein